MQLSILSPAGEIHRKPRKVNSSRFDPSVHPRDFLLIMKANHHPVRARNKMYTEGCRLTRAGKFAEAIGLFTQAIEMNIHRAEAYFRRGVCHYLLGHTQMAMNDMDAATVLGCQDAQMWSRYALPHNDDTAEQLDLPE